MVQLGSSKILNGIYGEKKIPKTKIMIINLINKNEFHFQKFTKYQDFYERIT